MEELFSFSSVEDIPALQARAAFQVNSAAVFREDTDTIPIQINDNLSYMPWGADNLMPYDILRLIEEDETLSTCQMFNAEVCYGSGLTYDCANASPTTTHEVEQFFLDNDIPSYFLGACQDFKHFGFCISVIVLDKAAKHIVRLYRKEACYCRFAPVGKDGSIPYILFANWRKAISDPDEVERIELLCPASPWQDLATRLGIIPGEDGRKKVRTTARKFAIVSRVPTPDSTYYPIPYYAALFKGSWYNIKKLIGIAKETKLKNAAPIKYQIEVSDRYWEGIFRRERITDMATKQKRVVKEKQQILDFLTGVENSGKVWFTTFYVNPNGDEQSDVKINKIETDKEGGDWETDIIEAINMICFTMRVHSNLVGSVPGKSQTNNSGSDKRELYTIAQALQKPYHDLLFNVHRLIIQFNKWQGAKPDIPFVMLSTLDENRDAKLVSTSSSAESKEKGTNQREQSTDEEH